MYKFSLVLSLLFLAVFNSCSNKEKPIIEFDKMQSILADVYIAEVYAAIDSGSKVVGRNKNLELLSKDYISILEHHNISKDEFLYSLDWYTKHPKTFDSLFKNLVNHFESLSSDSSIIKASQNQSDSNNHSDNQNKFIKRENISNEGI